jgi:polysaccharide pyruvyl transferase CsaB
LNYFVKAETMKQIFVLGAYGQNNLGDDALLEVFKQQLIDYRLLFNSARPEETALKYGVKTVRTYWGVPRFSRPLALLRSNVYIFGGGSLLKEIEGNSVRKFGYLVKIILMLLLAKLLGKKSLMLGNGMGPLHGNLYKKLSVIAANMTDLICVRDKDSEDLLKKIGVSSRIVATADPVFTVKPRPLRSEDGFPFDRSEAPLLVVIPRYSLNESEKKALAEALDLYVESKSARVVFIPFQTGFKKKFDDLETAEQIRQMMRYQEAAKVWVAPDSNAALAAIGQAELVISARLHGLIFAALQNIPAIAINYEVKVGSFMAELGMTPFSLTPKQLQNNELPSVLNLLWQVRERATEHLRERVPVLVAKANQTFELAREELTLPGKANILRSGSLLFISMTVVNAGNYLSNLILGRWLGPAGFADFSLIVTLLLVAAFINSTLQMVTAKFGAIYTVQEDLTRIHALRRTMGTIAWIMGAVMGLVLGLGAQFWSEFFHTASPLPFVLFSIGLPFYLAMGIDRGVLQGRTRFGPLAVSYQVEMWTRLGLAIVLVALGFSVDGAVGAVTASLVLTWLVARSARKGLSKGEKLSRQEKLKIVAFSGPVSAALVGQVLINNSDILMVKHFFDSEQAGLYSAVALIGRIVFFATWSIVTTLFPVVAQLHQKGQPHRHLLWLSLGIVGGLSTFIVAATVIFPEFILNILFGDKYIGGASLLWLYASLTALYAMSNVIINYRLSAGNGGSSFLAVLAGICQISGIWLFHADLMQVIVVQLLVMGGLFAILFVWDIWLNHRTKQVVTQGKYEESKI